MKNVKLTKDTSIYKIILFNVIIIAIAISLLACNSPRGSRYNLRQNQKPADIIPSSTLQIDKESKSNKNNTNAQVENQSVNNLADNASQVNDESILNMKHLPLNEQVRRYQVEHEKIKNDIKNIETEIGELSASIEEIKNAIKVLKGDKVKNAVAGPEQDDIENTDNNTKNDDNLILPDDEDAIEPLKVTKGKQAIQSQKVLKDKSLTPSKSKKIVKKPVKSKKVQQEVPKSEVTPKNSSKTSQKVENDNSETSQNMHKELNSAIDFVSKQEFNKAIDELNKLASQEKEPVALSNCNYWLGESYFGLREYNKAIQHYQKVLKVSNSPKNDNAQIMIAEAHVRSGQVAEAKRAFESLIEKYPQSNFVPRAKKMLQQL